MSCNCKNKNLSDIISEGGVKSNNKKMWHVHVVGYTVKSLVFLLTLIIGLPILNVYVIFLLFKLLVLNKNLDTSDLVSSLVNLTKKFTPKDDDDDDDDEDDDEFELTDVDDITEVEELTILEKN
jgi:hypothetical protein